MRTSLLSLVAALAMLLISGCDQMRYQLISALAPEYEAAENETGFKPVFHGADAKRDQISVQMIPVAEGIPEITDIEFPPHSTEYLLASSKRGKLFRIERRAGRTSLVRDLNVTISSEQGLLGVAFHPQFPQRDLLYLNYTLKKGGTDVTRISEWRFDGRKIDSERVLLEVEQPYPNHNAGDLAFGPDGFLYIGMGDGGWRNDPGEHGQNPKTLLGTMLRIDVTPGKGRPYTIPADNPFQANGRAEVYAIGLRNPWRYSFNKRKQLIVADVGQNKWEEITLVEKGDNLGWKTREAFACFDPQTNCPREGLRDPVYSYGREEGQSVTGGYEYSGSRIPALRGKYVFADFVSGRIWAIEVPTASNARATKAYTLGRWPMTIATFGQDSNGEIYVGDFSGGKVYRIGPG